MEKSIKKQIMCLLVTMINDDADDMGEVIKSIKPLQHVTMVCGMAAMISKGDEEMESFCEIVNSMTCGADMKQYHLELTELLQALADESCKHGLVPAEIEKMRIMATGIKIIELVGTAMRAHKSDS